MKGNQDYGYAKLAWPLIVILAGVIFLLDNFGIVPNAWGKLWPVILIVVGIAKLFGPFTKK